jgi:hypothetical protein
VPFDSAARFRIALASTKLTVRSFFPGSSRFSSPSQDPLPDRCQLEWLVASCTGLAWVLGDFRLHFVDRRADDHLDQLGRKSRFLSA